MSTKKKATDLFYSFSEKKLITGTHKISRPFRGKANEIIRLCIRD